HGPARWLEEFEDAGIEPGFKSSEITVQHQRNASAEGSHAEQGALRQVERNGEKQFVILEAWIWQDGEAEEREG
ncbi:MAG: hypothetical protein OK454_05490, partial [Thaumarchaeota archaeon]|nr:hypothetical protein [Nitrososphaerota archaeon]